MFSEEEDRYDIFNILETNEDEVEDRAVEAFELAASVALHDTDRNGIAADKNTFVSGLSVDENLACVECRWKTERIIFLIYRFS